VVGTVSLLEYVACMSCTCRTIENSTFLPVKASVTLTMDTVIASHACWNTGITIIVILQFFYATSQ